MKVVLQMVCCLKKDMLFLVQRKHQKDLQLCFLSLAQRDHLLLMMLGLFKNFYKLDNQAKHLVMVMNSKINDVILSLLSTINTWKLFMVENHSKFSMLTCLLSTFLVVCG